jgi:hypothetical protein
MRDAFGDVLFNFFAYACCCGAALLLGHSRFLLFLKRLCGFARTFAGTGIGASTLATARQTLAVTHATVAAQVHQSLDVHGQLTAQIAFDHERANCITQFFQFAVVQILDLFIGRYTRFSADLLCAWTADTIHGGQADDGVLMIWDVNPCNTCHSLFLNK